MLGHLISLELFHFVEIQRDFSFATLLMLCGQVPTSVDLSSGVCPETRRCLEVDFSTGFPSHWALMKSLKIDRASTIQSIQDIIRSDIGDAQLEWMFKNFSLSDGPDWISEVQNKIGRVIYHYLFDGRVKVGKAIREGFLLSTTHAKFLDVPKEKQAMCDGIAEITIENIRCIFTGKNSMTPQEFLRVCEFSHFLQPEVVMFFKTCIARMTSAERCRLATFITGLEFFGSDTIGVELACKANGEPVSEESLPMASTCSKKLYLPPYKDVETMYRKLTYTILDRSFGNE